MTLGVKPFSVDANASTLSSSAESWTEEQERPPKLELISSITATRALNLQEEGIRRGARVIKMEHGTEKKPVFPPLPGSRPSAAIRGAFLGGGL